MRFGDSDSTQSNPPQDSSVRPRPMVACGNWTRCQASAEILASLARGARDEKR